MPIIDLTLKIEDNMPAHKLFQRPVITAHFTHESSKKFNLGVPGDQMTFATTHLSMLDHSPPTWTPFTTWAQTG